MIAEHELRILEIDPVAIGQKIVEAGGRKVQDRLLQKRYTYNVIPVDRNKWVRLRTNGAKTTLAIKHVTGSGVSDTKEIEVEVSDFKAAASLMNEMGIKANSYQENYRTLYEFNGAEIMVDEWPLIPPYFEIEAESPEAVHETIKKLGFDLEHATGLDVSSIYEQIYKIDVDNMPELKFDIKPKLLAQ
jgi:adenylate cyclase, class 2